MFPFKLSENHEFSNDSRRSRSQLILLIFEVKFCDNPLTVAYLLYLFWCFNSRLLCTFSQKERLLRKKNSKENHFIPIHTFFLISNFGQDFRFICCFLVPNQVLLSIYHLRDNPYTVNHQKNLTLKVCKNQNLFSVCEVEEDLGSIWDSFKTGVLTHFSLNLHFI